MYRTIVVGTDGSGTAEVALVHAINLAEQNGAALHVVHAYHLASAAAAAQSAGAGAPTIDHVAVNDEIHKESDSILQRAVEAAARQNVTAEKHPYPGDASNGLVSVAEEVNADLIVVGNRGMSGVRRFVLGSVPNKVSHHCPCSLLIVNTA
jgi:nucleotide-binding universal stress UspA family protein